MSTTVDSDFGPIDVDESPPQRRQPPARSRHNFEVINTHPLGRRALVYMDGNQLLGVTRVKTKIDVMGLTKITITFYAESLNAPDLTPAPPDPPRVSDQPEG